MGCDCDTTHTLPCFRSFQDVGLGTGVIIAIAAAVILLIALVAACVYRSRWQAHASNQTAHVTLDAAALSEIDTGYAKLNA